MERLKIVDYVINQVVDVSQLQIFFETANKTFEGVFDGFDILKFLLEDDESIYFPLHERHKLIKMDPKKDMFERIKSEKSVYDRLEAERQKARFLKQTAMVKAEPKKKPEVQIHRLQAQKSPFGPGKPLESRPNASVSVSRYGQQGGFISSVKLSSAFGSRQQNIMDRSARTPVETSQIQVERLTEDPELSDDDLDLSWKLRESQIKKIRIAIKSLRVLKGYDDADLGHIKKMLLLQARKEAIQKSNKPFELKDARLLSQVERAPFSPNFDIRLEQFKNIYQDAFRLYDIDDELLIEAVWGAIEYSQPLRHKILPLMCKKGDPEELHRFQTQQENALKYPLDGHLGTSIWTGNSAMFPESTMRDYFGEKITLYFSFLAFYRDELVYPVIVGILQNIIIIVYFAADVPPVGLVRFSADWYIKKVFQWSSFAFAGYIVVWSKRVVFLWEGYEDNFCAKYSIKKQEEGQEENYTVRTKFKGKLGRNISTDLMNERMEIKPWTFFIQIVILIFVLGSVALALFVSWAILQWKREYFVERYGSLLPAEGKLSLIDTPEHLFTMIEFVRVKIFEWTFSRVISKLLFWKNRKFKEHHEGETIVCLAMFDLLNNSALLFIVGVETLLQNNRNYRSQEPESRCTNLSCSDEIIKFYLMYMVMAVCWTIGWKLILSKILDKLREYSNKAVKSLSKLAKKVKNSFHKAKFMKAAMAMKKKKKNTGRKRNKDLPMDDSMDSSTERDQLDRILYIHHSHPEKFYDQINQEIDYQVTELQAYKDGGELDQELFDYLEIFNLHSFLALFGVLFPIVFVIGLAITFAEWKMDLHDLIKGTKRSVPVEASSIGVWLNMLKLVSVLSACTNTFFVAFILFEQSSFYDKLGLFLLSSIGLLSMIFIWDHQYKMESAGSFIASRAKYIKGFLEAKLERRLEFSKDVPNIVLKKELTKDMRIFGGDLPSDHRGVNVQNLALQNDLEIDKEAQEKVFQAKLEMVYRSVCPSDKERRRDSHKQELVSPEPSPSRSPA